MDYFVNNYKYFKDEMVSHFIAECFDIKDPTFDYIGEDAVMFGDYCFSIGDIIYVLSNEVAYEDFLKYYDMSLLVREYHLNLEEYLTDPIKLKEQKEKHLKELKARVILAEEEFKKAIDEYSTTIKEESYEHRETNT